MPLADFSDLLDRVEQGAAAGDVPALEQWAAAAPGHATAHVALAHACEQADRRKEARQSWQRAALLLPGSPAVRAGLRRTTHQSAGHSASRVSEEASGAKPGAKPDAKDPAVEEVSPKTASLASGSENEDGRDEEALPTLGSAALRELVEASPESADVGAHDHLDGLIEELEGARIEPTPNPTDVPAPNLDADASDMVSPTLARIYQAQEQYAEAARVYRRLAEEHPDRAEEHRRQARAMQARADEEAPADENDPTEENRADTDAPKGAADGA